MLRKMLHWSECVCASATHSAMAHTPNDTDAETHETNIQCVPEQFGAGRQADCLMRDGAKATWPNTLAHGEGRGTTGLSPGCKSTDTLGQADENRQREHVHRRNLRSGITAILSMSIALLYRPINAEPLL